MRGRRIVAEKEIPARGPGFLPSNCCLPVLGGAALTVRGFVFFFVLALAALLLLPGLVLLILLPGLTAVLAALSGLVLLCGLVAWLSRLTALLARLSTLLFVFLHIVCHEIFLPIRVRNLAHPAI